MSNYYTEFFCLPDPGLLQKARAALARFDHLREHDSVTALIVYGFEISLLEDKGNSTLWIRDLGGYVDADEVLDFVLRLASEIELAGRWGFEYSYTCSRPKPDGSGGGGAIDLGAATIICKTTTDEALQAAFCG